MCVLNEENRGPVEQPKSSTPQRLTETGTRAHARGPLRLVDAALDSQNGSPTSDAARKHTSPPIANGSRSRPWKSSAPPTPEEIAQALDTGKFPPILTPEQAANLLQLALPTLYKHVSQGKYKHAVRRGNPLRFWRDRLIQAFFAP